MKRSIFLTTCLVISLFFASAQNRDSTQSAGIRNIFNQSKGSFGAYIGIWTGYAQFYGKDGYSFGVNTSCLINHSFGIGISASIYSNDYYIGYKMAESSNNFRGGYTGLYLEPIILARSPVHFSIPLTLGVGGISCTNTYNYGNNDIQYYIEENDIYMVAEPGFDIELNIIKHLRLSLGAKYRFTSGIKINNYGSHVLDNYTICTSLKIGKF